MFIKEGLTSGEKQGNFLGMCFVQKLQLSKIKSLKEYPVPDSLQTDWDLGLLKGDTKNKFLNIKRYSVNSGTKRNSCKNLIQF